MTITRHVTVEEEEETIVLVPTSHKAATDLIYHFHVDVSHLGIRATLQVCRKRMWIPSKELTELTTEVARTCNHCQFNRRKAVSPQPLHPLPRFNACDVWAFDFIGPSSKTKNGNQYILTAMDLGADYTFAEGLVKRSADSVIRLLRFIICMFGKPKEILSDNGEEFFAYAFKNLLQRLTIGHLHTSPYHPQTNS